MPDIALSLIDPNPFRDFELHPIDEAQVGKLKASIDADGFWTSVVARRVGDRYQLAFGHHRIEAARDIPAIDSVPIEVRDLSDWQMARMLATENATQRGTTAAASLDAIAGISKVLLAVCLNNDLEGVWRILQTPRLSRDAIASIWGKLRQGEAPGRHCIVDALPEGAYTETQVRLALTVLNDSGAMSRILAEAHGTEAAADPVFDASCARLFKLDYHLAEFRRIVTGDVVRSYLPVERQFWFGQQIIKELGDRELTAIKLRERANVIFYEELGMPRHAMRNSPLRLGDDRVKDAMNLMRRGTHSIKQCCRMLADLMVEGTDVAPEVIDRFKDYIVEIDQAIKSLKPDRGGKRSSNLRLIVNNREDVA